MTARRKNILALLWSSPTLVLYKCTLLHILAYDFRYVNDHNDSPIDGSFGCRLRSISCCTGYSCL